MIVIVFALEFESAYFRAKFDPRLRMGIWTMGAMGEAVTAPLQQKLRSSKPGIIVSAGFAGALQPGFQVGDLLVGANYSDPEVLAKLKLSGIWRQGNVLTVPSIIEHGTEKQRLGRESGAAVADMESAHVAALCREHAIPMLSVRCISDGVEDDMPVPAAVLMKPNGRPDSLALFRHLVANPGAVVGFNRLVKNARKAQASLSEGLEELVPQLLRLC